MVRKRRMYATRARPRSHFPFRCESRDFPDFQQQGKVFLFGLFRRIRQDVYFVR